MNVRVRRDAGPAARVAPADSVLCCLSRGLGAPAGSILAGTDAFVEAARRARQLRGGGLRRAGLVAAPGPLALENRDRLATDHGNAARPATELDALDGPSVPAPEASLVVADVAGPGPDAAAFVDARADRGVGCGALDRTTVRFCTHCDVDREDVTTAVDRVATAVQSSGSR